MGIKNYQFKRKKDPREVLGVNNPALKLCAKLHRTCDQLKIMQSMMKHLLSFAPDPERDDKGQKENMIENIEWWLESKDLFGPTNIKILEFMKNNPDDAWDIINLSPDAFDNLPKGKIVKESLL